MSTKIVAALAIEAVLLAMCLVVVLDLSAHRKTERLGGVNIWNYRGPVVHQKQLREIRVTFVGGTRAFSWGVAASETVPSAVRWFITLTTDRPGEPLRPVVGINLGQPGAVAQDYASIVERYAYLDSDYICLYDDLGVPGADRAPRTSGIFELTGYMPALPLVAGEKGARWRGDVGASGVRRLAGGVLSAIGTSAAAADRALARSVSGEAQATMARDADAYVSAMTRAIEAAQRHSRGVVVAVSPAETDEQRRNLAALRQAIEPRVSHERLRFVDLGQVARLYDHDVRLDGWNFSAAGISLVSQTIAPAMLDLIEHP